MMPVCGRPDLRVLILALLPLAAPIPGLAQTAPAIAALSGSFDALLAEVLDRMETVFAEDRAAGASGNALDPATTDALRGSLAAMVGAAAREGRPAETVERLFAYAALRRFRRDVPDWLKDKNGRLDTATLLASAGLEGGSARGRRDNGYLSAIQAEGADTRVRTGDAAQTSAADPVAVPAPPDNGQTTAVAPIPEDEPAERFVIVQTGDTLTSLALDHYGDLLEYRRIYSANRDLIQNPSLLYPGTRLRLPR